MAATRIKIPQLADGTDGELITWDSSGVPTTVAVGTSGHVLTSNGVGAAPTFQATTSPITASNGLTLSSNNIVLGGSLTGNTTITTTSSYTLNVATSRAGAANAGFIVTNNSTGSALKGVASGTGTGYGVWGTSTDNYGVRGESTGIAAGAFFTIDTNSNVLNGLIVDRQFTGGSPSNGIGTSIEFRNETSTTSSTLSNSLISKWTNATHAARVSEFSIDGVYNTVQATLFTLAGSGKATLNKYGVGSFTSGTAVYTLQVDASGNIIEGTVAGASGDVLIGGNSPAADMSIGTNNSFGLNLETNGIPRLNITGGASTGGVVTITSITANTSTVQDTLVVRTNSSGTAAAGFGGGILFQGESTTTDNQDMARISSYWTTATHASREAAISFQIGDNAGALTEYMKLDAVGSNTGSLTVGSSSGVSLRAAMMVTAQAYTIGNSANALTLGGSSGTITASTSNNTSFGPAILVNSTGEFANGGIGIQLGNASYTGTSLNKTSVYIADGYAAASGSGTMNSLFIGGTINQTSTASGTIKGLVISPTLTSITGAYRALEIGANNTLAKGIYQTGALTTNNFVGKTMFGSTAAPTSNLEVTASTSTGTDVGVKITGPAYTTTPTDNKVLQLTASYTRASGGGLVTMLGINPTVNFTSTTTATMSAIDISPTLTAMTSGSRFYGIYINANNSSVRGIFQSGGSAMNIFEGKTAIGSTTDPTEALVVTGNTVTTGQQNAGDFAITDAAGFNVNWNNGNTQYVTIAANRIPTFSNPKNGARYLLRVIQGTGGSKLITWPTVTWRGGTAPTLTTTAAKQDLITLIYSNGVYYGDASLNY